MGLNLGGWYTFNVSDEFHVVPNDDLKDHEMSRLCWCRPVVDDECDDVITHNSMDGREQYEECERKMS